MKTKYSPAQQRADLIVNSTNYSYWLKYALETALKRDLETSLEEIQILLSIVKQRYEERFN